MKRDEMIASLQKQYEKYTADIENMKLAIQNRQDLILKIEGALEALEALEVDEPQLKPAVPDHTEAAIALGVLK